MPGAGSPLAWDRYACVNDNPVRYADPSGHWGETFIENFEIPIRVIITLIATVAAFAGYDYDTRRRHETIVVGGCQETLTECFQSDETIDFHDHEQIDQGEFEVMLYVVYDDLHSEFRTPHDYARTTYDTPFYDGNPVFGDKPRTDQIVCFGDKCYHQSAVNYVAQGMYSVSAGQSLEDVKELANFWNDLMYGHPVTEEELYWLEYGYNYYKRKEDHPE